MTTIYKVTYISEILPNNKYNYSSFFRYICNCSEKHPSLPHVHVEYKTEHLISEILCLSDIKLLNYRLVVNTPTLQ